MTDLSNRQIESISNFRDAIGQGQNWKGKSNSEIFDMLRNNFFRNNKLAMEWINNDFELSNMLPTKNYKYGGSVRKVRKYSDDMIC